MRYLLVEMVTSILLILVYHEYGFSVQGFAYMCLTGAVITAAVIDLDHLIIPNSLNLFIGSTGIFFMLMGWTVNWKQGLLGFVVGGGTLFLLGILALWILKKEGMGGGDIKFLAVCGLYLGMERILISLLLTSYIAALIVLILLATGKLKRGQYVPFGPYISAGVITVTLFLDEIIYFYHQFLFIH